MLPLSGASIRLNRPSRDYVLGIILLHVLAVVVVVRSALPNSIVSIFVGLLLGILIYFLYYRLPSPRYEAVTYHVTSWQLHDTVGSITIYESALFKNMGFFLLLTLQQKHRKKTLVIFTDQLTLEERRVLQWITYAPITDKN